MYTLKSIARRGSLLGAAGALLVATIFPAASAFADALNPLTERSLLLSSSAPGFMESDGSGNTVDNKNAVGEYYAPPGSGPNGKRTGETFTFNVSTDSVALAKPIKALTFQYCTEAAGKCQSPGNNTGDARTTSRTADSLALGQSDLNVNLSGAVLNVDYEIYVNNVKQTTAANWVLTTSNVEDTTHSGALSGKNNFITIAAAPAAPGISPTTGQQVKIVFKASDTKFITNPGKGSFFVKINTYDTEDTSQHIPAVPAITNTHIIDGGVTVANVMTDSIHITTKVLETMAFSVGTRNRDTVAVDCAIDVSAPDCEGVSAVHGTCDPIQQINNNRLQLGNPDAEYSLETGKAYDVYSYWRLSSNSSGGATVYYSGNTLANTVGDEISEIGATAAQSTRGTEQFGLGFTDASADTMDSRFTDLVTSTPLRYKKATLKLASGPDVYLAPAAEYADGAGGINAADIGTPAKFAFVKSSLTVPVPIALNNSMVISCATAKMRYVANIGADTPAGVYTTKINYLAAPQY